MSAQPPENPLARALALAARNGARSEAQALVADLRGGPAVARLLRAVAASRQVHARRALLQLRGKVAGELDGVLDEFAGENQAALEEYVHLAAQAGPGPVAGLLEQCRKVESTYAGRLSQAQRAPEPPEVYHVCGVCGFLSPERAPERCPICGAVRTKFKPVK